MYLVQSTYWRHFQIELEFRSVGFLRRGENRSTRRKTSRSKDEHQQQTQPTFDAESGNRTRATLVGGECSHHCAILPPFHLSVSETFDLMSTVKYLNFVFLCKTNSVVANFAAKLVGGSLLILTRLYFCCSKPEWRSERR